MFLALRELRFARWRFTLMGSVVALIAVLVVLLSGLSSGLVNDGVSGLRRLPVTAFAFDPDVKLDSAFSRSVVSRGQVDTWRRQPGVRDAALFGNMLANARSDRGVPIDLALFGVEPDSFLAPAPAEGTGLGSADGIVVSRTAIEAGLRLGDTVIIDRIGTRLTVVGSTGDQRTYGHVDVAYLPLATWQRLHQGAGPGEALRAGAANEATAVAVQADDGADLAAADAAAGTTSYRKTQAYGASPGYTAETSTLQLIQVFLYAISALVVGAFFTVWTINRRHELAVLRAMGAARAYLLRDGLVQALVVLGASIGAGVAAGVGLGGLISGSDVPFAIEAPAVTVAVLLLAALGLIGAAFAIVRVAAVDPLTALGAHR
ncbi:ABC transporter permease [Dactylosporangium aurantiacum]|uniref:ABC transporter permease n=1 Tax=Dactylosporangium aurantiacum TaxID=35754 RepID=A0A9Q9MFX3_9ACTN|nr:ABC transporter permease [Dactylosporangium aurantiacum]MDG6106895.1 ABC transporter permease [Dactylosporangium aurantiacum]UWZ51026.1 ABC transporter permease [Dactylosporangium aurantiacum]